MTFCEKCGAELSDGVKFCQVCGAPVDNNTQANSDGFSGNVLGSEARDNEKNKGMGILSYIGILFIVPLIAAKDSKFAMFHANQGLVIFIATIILSFASGIISSLPYIGFIGSIISSLVGVVAFIYEILGIVSAAKGEMKELPYIGKIKIIK